MRGKAILVCTFLVISAFSAGAATYKTLHNFDYWYGSTPYAGLTFDQAGNLYGVTAYGGGDYTDGMVFKLSQSQSGWNYQVVYEFEFLYFYDPLGRVPIGGLVIDEAGNIYGTTTFTDDDWECGTVFKGSTSGWVPLHTFTGTDGCDPEATLTYSNGVLWGTTKGGGSAGQGTVFSMDKSGGSFQSFSFSGIKGSVPSSAFNLWGYGTTYSGGAKGKGNIYRLDPVKGLISKHSFTVDGKAGYAPMGDLLTLYVGDVRTIYGTTSHGGAGGGGTVYRLTETQPNSDRWRLRVLHSFSPDTPGRVPLAGLTADAAGSLYGTTSKGGKGGRKCGTVFKLAPEKNDTWTYTTLYSFDYYKNEEEGCQPTSGVVLDAAGNLYGTTIYGGWNDIYGTVYEIIP